jgi:hypothetical protein
LWLLWMSSHVVVVIIVITCRQHHHLNRPSSSSSLAALSLSIKIVGEGAPDEERLCRSNSRIKLQLQTVAKDNSRNRYRPVTIIVINVGIIGHCHRRCNRRLLASSLLASLLSLSS